MVGSIGFAGAVSWAPGPLTVFLFTALYLTPMLFNMFFHAVTSYLYRSYSPGLISAVVLFPALAWYLTSAFGRAGLLPSQWGVTATVLGAAIHAMDLASTTFFLKRRSSRLCDTVVRGPARPPVSSRRSPFSGAVRFIYYHSARRVRGGGDARD
jgi:hypothetical protein